MPKVNPLTLEKWTPSDDETLQSVMAGKLPDVFRGSQPKPQPVPTPAAQWTAMAAHISAILDQTQDKRRFILHYPQQAPFQVAVMFDIADPVKKCPAGVGDEGAPLMIARYRKHDPGWAPDEAKEAVVDFYKRQRDGFIREEAAVVQPGESIVGLEAPSKECVEECLRRFEANAELLDSSFTDRFNDSPARRRVVDLSRRWESRADRRRAGQADLHRRQSRRSVEAGQRRLRRTEGHEDGRVRRDPGPHFGTGREPPGPVGRRADPQET